MKQLCRRSRPLRRPACRPGPVPAVGESPLPTLEDRQRIDAEEEIADQRHRDQAEVRRRRSRRPAAHPHAAPVLDPAIPVSAFPAHGNARLLNLRSLNALDQIRLRFDVVIASRHQVSQSFRREFALLSSPVTRASRQTRYVSGRRIRGWRLRARAVILLESGSAVGE